ncbi:MAG: phage integrase family protein [Planctomycetaceae bacterium]|nr:phage integrase family protein [Planctomycetaceae bacterium]
MANSTRRATISKPDKPRDDFPLFAHNNGLWCKKIRGKLHYFGVWADPQAALDKWLDQKEDLLAGRVPRAKSDADELTLEVLVNEYLAAKQSDVEAGEYSSRTFQGAFTSCESIVQHFGQRRVVADIRQEEFAAYRKSLVKAKYAPNTINTEVSRCKALFNWAYQAELIDRPLRYGPQFRTNKKSARRQKAKAAPKMFEAAEVRQMIDVAGTQLKAMILLGVNCGFGNTDCSELPQSALDLKGGWVDFPRPKTGVERRAVLWPETVQALREAIKSRPEPKNPEDNGLVFMTTYGNRWVRMEPSKTEGIEPHWQDGLTMAFREVVKGLGLVQKGRGFYAFRRTFRTIADESNDWPAINMIMGHTDPTIGGVYRQRISDERLRAVTDHVRAWLYGGQEGGAK